VSSCTLLQELHLRPDSACSRGKLEPFALGCRVRGELCTEVAHTHRLGWHLLVCVVYYPTALLRRCGVLF
jgi:hypothetical protein